MQRTSLWIVLVCVFALSTIVFAQDATETPEESVTAEATEASTEIDVTPGGQLLSTAEATAPPLVDAIPFEIAAHAEEWPLANKDYSNTRATFNSAINASTVNQLEVVWSFPIPGRANYGAAASAPLIIGNEVYFQDLASNTYALDIRTGEVLWRKMYDNPVIGPNGPAVGYGKVFIISGVDTFAALDIETGEEVWSVNTGGRPTGAFQPYVFDEKVYITTQAGVAGDGEQTFRGYEGGTSGHIYALNQETGETIWEFQTVEEGFWGNPEINSGGGVWFSPAIDPLTGLTFWGTGNPAPFPGTFEFPNASSRPEPNLYTNSLLALDHDTGELVWYNYVNPNDIFDLDFQISPMLATIQSRGVPRDIVIGSGKLGHIIAFDRKTGELLWDTRVGIHQNDDLSEIPPNETVVVYPGVLGGVETPMAYADGTVYAPVLNLPTEYSATGHGARTGSEAVANAEGHTPIGQGTSEVVALDAATGQIKWSHELPSGNYGGVTVVNDLLFTATFDGMIYALDRASGQTVWSYQASAGINAWPAVSGNTIVWPAGFGDEPALIALRLGSDEMTAEATAEVTSEATAETTSSPDVEATSEAEPQATGEATPAATEQANGGEQSSGQQSGEYLSVDEENQTINLTIIAAEDDTNGGLNFNGYANGEATVTVPVGWTVKVTFENASNLPHSALVVAPDAIEQNDIGGPIFEGATTPNPETGTTETQEFTFTAQEEGDFIMACGVPGHGAQGQWINFVVGPQDAQASFEAGGG